MTALLPLLSLVCGVSATWSLPPPVVPDWEVVAGEARLLEALDVYGTRSCPRGVLRGEPLQGSAADDMRLLTEGGDALAECYRFLDQFGSLLFGPPVDDREQQTGLVNRFSEICEPLSGVIRDATRHEDACSPYMPGLRGLPDLQIMLRSLRAARQLAALAALSGHPDEAGRRFMDLLRFLQDLLRGGAPMILTAVSTSATLDILINDLPQLFSRPDLGAGDRVRIGEELERLMGSEPSFQESVVADSVWLAYEAGLPLLRGIGWTPSGGFSLGHSMSPADYEPDLLPWVTPSQERGVIFTAFMDLVRLRSETCPAAAPLQDCAAGLQELAAFRRSRTDLPAWQSALRIIFAPSPRRAWRAHLIDRIQRMVDAPFQDYAAAFGDRMNRFEAAVSLCRSNGGVQ